MIWVKTRYDNGLKMNIPHSENIAHAMYGFRQLGAEMQAYESIDDIYDKVGREDIVLDYIDQCQCIFDKFGLLYNLPNYPDCLREYLGRQIWTDTINSIASDEKKWSAGWFVKPMNREKAFTGKVISSIADLIGCGNCHENYEVLCSEKLDILAEWRGFILYDKIIDLRSYGLLLDTLRDKEAWHYSYDADTVENMMEDFRKWKDRPASCSMDIGVVRDSHGNEKTVLIEMNDSYALGNYGLPSIFYAKLISARWSQLFNREDIYNF